MMGTMPDRPDPRESWESYFRERPPRPALRSFKRELALERKHTEKLVRGLHLAIHSEIGFLEQRTAAKFDEIDASLNLIASELARRANDRPPG